MNRIELEEQALRGEEVGRLLACVPVREVVKELLAERRRAILDLKSGEREEFTRLKAGLEAMEELLASLESVADLGGQARELLERPDGDGATGGRVL